MNGLSMLELVPGKGGNRQGVRSEGRNRAERYHRIERNFTAKNNAGDQGGKCHRDIDGI